MKTTIKVLVPTFPTVGGNEQVGLVGLRGNKRILDHLNDVADGSVPPADLLFIQTVSG